MNLSRQLKRPLIIWPSIIDKLTRDIIDNKQYNLYLSLIIDPTRGLAISALIVKGVFEFFLTKLKFK